MHCKKNHEIEVAGSPIGYTLVAFSRLTGEVCRMSRHVTDTPEKAEFLPFDNQRSAECLACNGNGSCFL